VLNHLQPPGDNTYQNVKVFFKEAYRVLNRNGALILNISFEEQVEALWFATLLPQAAEAQKLRFLSAWLLSGLIPFCVCAPVCHS